MRTRTIIITIAVLLVGGAVFGYMEYNRGTPGAGSLPVKENVNAERLLVDFQADEAAANTKYVGATEQVIQVSGTIRSLEPVGEGLTNVVLETGDTLAGIVCEFPNKELPGDWRPGANVVVKGICTGLLMDVVLVRCVASN